MVNILGEWLKPIAPPAKGKALWLNMPHGEYPLVRITRLPIVKDNAARFAVEYFAKNPA